ncbi:MAG: thermostable hemolysin [Steroidobacteraceae bacterium]|nr:thermostable hemolysin [Steroidobacteraceae bacterium]
MSAERTSLAATDDRVSEAESYRIEACSSCDKRRRDAEQFVRDRFERTHGARISELMPTLLILSNATGSIHGVCGYRLARTEQLFLEQYLDAPIERLLSMLTRRRVDRERVVEVGNFASTDARAAKALVATLTAHLLERNLLWAGFTATSSMRRLLHLMGARALDLGSADGARVQHALESWGRYYTHHPRVMAGFLPKARRLPAFWRTCRAS